MKAYILPYHSEQERITAVIHGEVKEAELAAGHWMIAKRVILNISDESDKVLMTRFGGWFVEHEVLFKKIDVVSQLFHPTPGKGSVRY